MEDAMARRSSVSDLETHRPREAAAVTAIKLYEDNYERGWKASGRATNLDDAEDRYRSKYGDAAINAWTDGWMDRANGRSKWSLRDLGAILSEVGLSEVTTEGEGTMTTYDEAITKAAEIGREHGTNAASWFFDGNTATEYYRSTLRALEAGDPMVYDQMPAPDLSGEWADGYSVRQLGEDTDSAYLVNRDDPDEGTDVPCEVVDAYEFAFSEAVEAEIVRVCRYQLADEGDLRAWHARTRSPYSGNRF
jgi:hypothetical protein